MKSLIINPGSTSTKIAVYEDTNMVWLESIEHKPEEIRQFAQIFDQLLMRQTCIEEAMKSHGTDWNEISVIMSRGGLLPPVSAGAYTIDEALVETLRFRPQNEHASNLGAGIALSFSGQYKIPSYIYDPVTVDEMLPIAKITGLPDIERKGMGHNLNMRACAIRFAAGAEQDYSEVRVIVAHLGGGITLSLHDRGRITDMISDDDGPFSPERAGGLPVFQVIAKMEKENLTRDAFMKIVQRQGGLTAYFGTSDAREVEAMIEAGDERAKLVFDAMALNVARSIARLSVMVNGQVDAVLLTGGLANSRRLVEEISRRIKFLAPVHVYPGEHEMEALALGGWRIWNGKEEPKRIVD